MRIHAVQTGTVAVKTRQRAGSGADGAERRRQYEKNDAGLVSGID